MSKADHLQSATMALMLFVWEFLGMYINPLIAHWRAVVVVKLLRVWITFPIAQISRCYMRIRGSLNMLYAFGATDIKLQK